MRLRVGADSTPGPARIVLLDAFHLPTAFSVEHAVSRLVAVEENESHWRLLELVGASDDGLQQLLGRDWD